MCVANFAVPRRIIRSASPTPHIKERSNCQLNYPIKASSCSTNEGGMPIAGEVWERLICSCLEWAGNDKQAGLVDVQGPVMLNEWQ